MRNVSKQAKKAQGASNATEQMPTRGKTYTRYQPPADDEEYELLNDNIFHLIKRTTDGIIGIYDNFPTEIQQKHAIYDVLYTSVENDYPYRLVLDNLNCYFRTIAPEYILSACNSVYSNSFLSPQN